MSYEITMILKLTIIIMLASFVIPYIIQSNRENVIINQIMKSCTNQDKSDDDDDDESNKQYTLLNFYKSNIFYLRITRIITLGIITYFILNFFLNPKNTVNNEVQPNITCFNPVPF